MIRTDWALAVPIAEHLRLLYAEGIPNTVDSIGIINAPAIAVIHRIKHADIWVPAALQHLAGVAVGQAADLREDVIGGKLPAVKALSNPEGIQKGQDIGIDIHACGVAALASS